jgi:uncharacterized membrane protein YkvA (DUF1232 family)
MQLIHKLKQRARQLKTETLVLAIAYADKRTPLTAKILIGLTVGYLLSPIDLIPDFIPVLGYLDDLLLVPFLITLSIRLIPKHVLAEARQHLTDNPQKLKKNNWIFASVIILIWLAIIFYLFNHFKYLWAENTGS